MFLTNNVLFDKLMIYKFASTNIPDNSVNHILKQHLL